MRWKVVDAYHRRCGTTTTTTFAGRIVVGRPRREEGDDENVEISDAASDDWNGSGASSRRPTKAARPVVERAAGDEYALDDNAR
jgi:hypothetical protein